MLSLNDILGQDRALAVLRGCIASGRVHHAWVFHGPDGVGKSTTARAFAGALLEPGLAPNLAGELKPDPDSPTQRLIDAGAHPDLRIISKELAQHSRKDTVRRSKQRSIAVEVIREFLIEPAGLGATATSGAIASRVFIVEEAHLMERESANTILKLLEEPPRGVVLILLTNRESLLLPTIRSRCQRVGFGPLDDASMRAWMSRSGPAMDEARREWTLAFAQGSPGAALEAHESGVYEWATTIQPLLEHMDRGRYPVELGATLAKLVEDWATEAVRGRPNASKDVANKAGLRLLMALFAAWGRKRLRLASDEHERARRLREIDLVAETEASIERNVNPGMALENFVAQLARA